MSESEQNQFRGAPSSRRMGPEAWLLGLAVLGLAAVWMGLQLAAAKAPVVVAYCAQDQAYAEAIFREFTAQTGIKVRAIYDNEAVKTAGLANRLLAERARPRCDVFWGNEEMRTRQLADRGIFAEPEGWAAFGHRSRRLVFNTNLLAATALPQSLLELTNAAWRGKVALAYPQFGTTTTHLHALRQKWGAPVWTAWCAALAANRPLLVDGNSVVVSMVGKGEASLGLTDSDDIAAGRREGLPVAAAPLTSEMLLLPNTVGLIRNAPHPRQARELFAWLQTPRVLDQLVRAHALEGAALTIPNTPTLTVDWPALLRDLEPTTAQLNQIFLR